MHKGIGGARAWKPTPTVCPQNLNFLPATDTNITLPHWQSLGNTCSFKKSSHTDYMILDLFICVYHM
jgi:hypothetical protein